MGDIQHQIQQAAELRVQGNTWEQCAQHIDKQPDTIRGWQYTHTEKWNNALLAAIDSGLGTLEHEALTTIRQLIRNAKTETNQLKAAKALLRHSRELRGTKQKIEHSGPDGGPIEHEVSEADRELMQLIEEMDNESESETATDGPPQDED